MTHLKPGKRLALKRSSHHGPLLLALLPGPGPLEVDLVVGRPFEVDRKVNLRQCARRVNQPTQRAQTIPQGQTSSPPKSFLTPTAKARPN